MNRAFDYRRKITSRRDPDRIIDLRGAGTFPAVFRHNPEPHETFEIDGAAFNSIHTIDSPGGDRVFTALRSDHEPAVLLVIWRRFPFYQQIEDGGDLMLQEIHDDERIRYLVIDNTFVRSGWMNDRRMEEYLNSGWMPGLLQLELKGFCHLQAQSYIGGQSFKKFGELVSENIARIAGQLGKKPFSYLPVRTSEMGANGDIDGGLRLRAFREAFAHLKTL